MLKKIILGVGILAFVLPLVFYVLTAYFSSRIYPVVEGRIYRSGQLSDDSLEDLIHAKGIKTVINLRGTFKNSLWYIRENVVSREHDVKLYDIGLSPNDLPKYRKLLAILNIIMTSEKPLLIHCNKGADRTGMVSALALAIERDPPLSEIKKQFSFRYGVLPFYRSAGPYFFSIYEQWLNRAHRTHTRGNLLYWIRHEYHDASGNLEFWIEQINGSNWREFKNVNAVLASDVKYIPIKGWAFNASTNSPVRDLYITIDNRVSLKADFVQNRPDIARFFSLGGKDDQDFRIGWEVRVEKKKLSAGCHSLSLRYVENDSTWDIPVKNTFCFE